MYTNAQKLAAVLNKWAAPLMDSMVMQNLGNIPLLTAIENKVKNSGWVSQQWSIHKELSPYMTNIMSAVIEPLISNYLQGIPDEAIPKAVHSIVDEAISKGHDMTILEGRVSFSLGDLQELKRYLDYNLPIGECGYEVIDKEP